MGEGRGWLARMLHRLTADTQELEAEDLRRAAIAEGAVPAAECRDGQDVLIAGFIRSVTTRARSGGSSLEVDVYDGSGTVTLVFIGRRHIPGIEAGRSLRASGRVVMQENRTIIFNPRYELLPAPSVNT